jgi:hypothetical protein
MTYEKSGNSFGKNVKAELMEFRARISAIEAQIKTISSGGGSGAVSGGTGESSGEGPSGASGEYVDGTFYKDVEPSAKAEEIGKATDNIKSYTDSVVDATYLIREASISMRGYGMLLDQMGISKDQKKMVKEMEEAMMMVHKAIQTLHLLEAANMAFEAGQGPLGLLEIGLAGGVFAGSLAYGSKVVGGAGV